MSVERNRMGFDGEISFSCDQCEDEEFHSDTADFQNAVALLKAEGWKIVKTCDGYEHICPVCNGTDEDDILEDFA